MPSLPTTFSPSTLRLDAAQRAWQHLSPGAEVRVELGSVCLHQRLYLAHGWAHMPVLLHAGDRYRVSAGGWLEMEALCTACVAVRPRRAWLRRLAAYWLQRAAPSKAGVPWRVGS